MTTSSTFCVAGGWSSTRDAEHAFGAISALLDGDHAYVATSFVPGERVVVSGAGELAALPETARLFVFPGQSTMVGVLTVADVLASGIDEVRGLGGIVPSPDELLDTQNFVRPVLEGRRLVLTVRPGRAGLIPFEQPNPTPCCADHG